MVATPVIDVSLPKVKCTAAECVIMEAALNAHLCVAIVASVCAGSATKNTRVADTRLNTRNNVLHNKSA